MEEKKSQKKVFHKLSTTADRPKTWEKISQTGKNFPCRWEKISHAERRKIAHARAIDRTQARGSGLLDK
jgi:hypothetical protein